MFVKLPDGRMFKTEKFDEIQFNENEKVYKYEFETKSVKSISSERHKWLVWDKSKKDLVMVEMKNIDKEKHELLIMDIDN